jgi:tRNA (guanosine-2'-O-)-methyltransferase
MLDKEEILSYFQQFLSDNKINLFEEKVLDRTKHVTLVLEDLFHPHNASAILRNCDCQGIQDVHIIENNHQFVNEKDISLGSSKWLSIHKYNDLNTTSPSCIDQLKEKGYTIAVLNPHHEDILIHDYPLDKKTAFVLGAEKFGLTKHSLENADIHIKVPIYGFTESYNVSVTAALTMYDVVQRLRKSSIHWELSEKEQWATKLEWTLRSIQSSSDIIQHFLKENPEAAGALPFSEFIQ